MIKLTLREYQEEAVKAGLDYFRNGKNNEIPIIVAPTGAGKSLYIGYMANELTGGILVIQPSIELLEQNYSKYKMYGGDASIYSASMKSKEVGHVTFATIGSIEKHPEEFYHVRYIIIDECHLVPPQKRVVDKKGVMKKKGSMYMNFISQLNDVKVLGLTATPVRLKSYQDRFTRKKYSQVNLLTRERPKFFNRFLFITQIKELNELGYLCPIKYHSVPWDNERLIPNSTGGEYSDETVDRELKFQKVYEKLPEIIEQSKQKGRKFRVVYVKNINIAEDLSARVPDSACVSSHTKPKDRKQILDDFKSGKITTVFNVGVLTTGFDFPELDTVIIAKPTMSITLYMQMIGRGIRLFEGKKDCFVLDMCGNFDRFGPIEDIEYVDDPIVGWIMKNKDRQISGVRME